MAKDPAFLFYTNDFSSGTQFFSDEQLGIYLRLLMAQHQHGHLSEKQVIFISKSYDNDIMQKFAKDEKGLFFNERLELEILRRKNYTDSRGRNKQGKTKDLTDIEEGNTSKSYEKHMENVNEDVNTNKDLDIINKEKPKKFDFLNSMIQLGFDKKLTEEWLLVRKNKKATNTETALKSFCMEIAKSGKDKNVILEICVSKSWSGFKSTWDIGGQKENKSQERSNQTMDNINRGIEILKNRDNGIIQIDK